MSYPESYKGDWVITSENGAIAFSGTYLEVRQFMVEMSLGLGESRQFNLWSVGCSQCNFVDSLQVNVEIVRA